MYKNVPEVHFFQVLYKKQFKKAWMLNIIVIKTFPAFLLFWKRMLLRWVIADDNQSLIRVKRK